MRKIILLSAVVVFALSCGTQSTVTDTGVKAGEIVLSGIQAQGKEIFDVQCSKCHGLPKREDFTKEAWIANVEKMIPKTKIKDQATLAALRAYAFK